MREILFKIFNNPLQYLAWFAPHGSLRVFSHRLRGVKIRKNVWIGQLVDIEGEDLSFVEIEDNVCIASFVKIIVSDGSYNEVFCDIPIRLGKVRIKRNSFIGVGSIILPGVTIGENSIIGAGSIVVHDIPPNTVAVGTPAKPIKKIENGKKDFMKKNADRWVKITSRYFWEGGK